MSFIYTTALFIILAVLILAPRSIIQGVRYRLKHQNMWLWKKMSLVHARLDDWLWRNGDGD